MSRSVADILIEALPHIRKLSGKTIVVKYGGHAMVDEQLKTGFAKDIALMKYVGVNPVVVHGGGPQISQVMERMCIKPKFVRGMRMTDQETMEVVEMVLGGLVNNAIVSRVNQEGGQAVGLSGKDAGLIQAKKLRMVHRESADIPPEIIDPGHVGEVIRINPGLIETLAEKGFIPIVAPIGEGTHGESYNINADAVASHMAMALSAMKLIFLTDVDGVKDASGNLMTTIAVDDIPGLITDGTISGGMIPKVEYARDAVRKGVGKVHIINGTKPHAVLLELFTEKGIGTEVIP
ncbi:MAG: acetylglutamate kinase [Pseudomonadota bacterium]